MPYAPKRPCYVTSCPHLRPCPEHGEKAPRPYNMRAWRTRAVAFLRAHPFCVDCRKRHRVTLAQHVDHIRDHCGDRDLFWDTTNWQGLCARCHGLKTGRTMRGTR